MRDDTLATTGPGPGSGPSGGTGSDGSTSFIGRDPSSGRTVLDTGNGTVYNIANGRAFDCLAASRYVWDNAALPDLTKVPVGNVSCAQAGPTTRKIAPAAGRGWKHHGQRHPAGELGRRARWAGAADVAGQRQRVAAGDPGRRDVPVPDLRELGYLEQPAVGRVQLDTDDSTLANCG